MVVEGGVGATSNGREVVVGEAVIVQGGLTKKAARNEAAKEGLVSLGVYV